MTIEDPQAYVASKWDWSILNGCFGDTIIRMQDIDGEVERNFKFLRIETKLPGVPLKQGQEIALKHYADNPQNTVLVLWGHPGKPTQVRIITKYNDRTIPCDLECLRSIVNTWFRHASDPDRWIDHAVTKKPVVHMARENGNGAYIVSASA